MVLMRTNDRGPGLMCVIRLAGILVIGLEKSVFLKTRDIVMLRRESHPSYWSYPTSHPR